MHADEFVQRLQQRGFKTKRNGRGWRSQCPAHGGTDLNLAISDGDTAIVCKCWSHLCSLAEIAEAVGLKEADLWFEQRPQSNGAAGRAPPKVFPYRDEAGTLLYEVRRSPEKDFKMWLPGAERPGIGAVRRVLFGIPELLQTQPGEVVAIAEGEKCALATAVLGLPATTNPNGAGQWRPEYTAWLAAHLPDRRFLVLPDNDEKGKKHALEVCDSLKAAGLKVWLADLGDLPPAGDVVQWIARGGTAEQLRAMAADAPPRLWAEVLTFAQLLEQPPPTWLIEGMFYEETMVEVFGEPNSGKSFVVIDEAIALRRGGEWCGRQIHRSGPILYVNADGGRGFSERARAWVEIHGRVEAPHEFWTLPRAINLCRQADMADLMALIAYLPEAPVMTVFDTYSRCIPGINENLQEFASMVVDHLDRIRLEFHTSVKLVHHTDLSGAHARGSSVIIGACDTQARVEKSPENVVSVKCEKQRDAAFFEPLYFQLGRVEGTNAVWITQQEAGPLVDRHDRKQSGISRVLAAVRRDAGITREALVLGLEMNKRTLCRYVGTLLLQGLIVETELPALGVGGQRPRGLFPV